MAGLRDLSVAFVCALTAGCGAGSFLSRTGGDESAGGAARPAQRTAERGAAALADGNHARASRLFAEALTVDPENSKLHLLNGLAYHAGYRSGARGQGQLAETGYRIALAQDPGNWRASYQLGLLYLDMRHYAAAQAHLAQAARAAPDDPDVHYALAVASYYQRDLIPAVWASRRAIELQPERPHFVHAAAMLAAAIDEPIEAAAHLERYRAVERDPGRVRHLARRMDDWRRIHAQLALEKTPLLAQAQPPPPPPPGADTPATPFPLPPPGAPPAPPAARMPVAFNWSDCMQAVTPPSAPAPVATAPPAAGFADETTPLPALPSPCAGLPLPRMALVDVTLVRTEETRATGQGVNLLDGLQVVLGGSATRNDQTIITTAAGAARTLTKTFISSIALPAAGITYALDLARASDTRVEIIARPTLVALDRTPSNFFSGSNVTFPLIGQNVANLQDKPVGVSLSVTPTFVDDNTMLLSVKATRSFFEPTRAGLEQQLSTTRNTVTANVMIKFGETLILSGMVERDLQDADSGVPLLRDLPGVQYFFGRRVTQDFRKEVVAILTPRRATFLAEALRSVEDYLSRPDLNPPGHHGLDQVRAQARRAVTTMTPNATALIAALTDNLFFHEFRSGDLAPPRTHGGPDFRRTLKEILELLYF